MAWVESPSYVLRRWTVLRQARRLPRGRVLEVGCGAGDLMAHLVQLGFAGTAVETSAWAREEAGERFRRLALEVELLPRLEDTAGQFDLVVACEVLEHLEDDVAALRAWAERVRPGGRLLVTVPGHPRRFGPSDEWAGHWRRYTRADLAARAADGGLLVESLHCTGFPLGNLIEPLRNRLHRRRLEREPPLSRGERTRRSGVDRPIEGRLRLLSSPLLVLPFCWLQLPFVSTDLGTGFLLVARRPAGPSAATAS